MENDIPILEPECRELTKLHPATRRRLEKKNQFPQRFRLGADAPNGRIGWSRREVLDWLAARMAARKRPDPEVPNE